MKQKNRNRKIESGGRPRGFTHSHGVPQGSVIDTLYLLRKLLLVFGSKITKYGVNKQLGDITVDMYIFLYTVCDQMSHLML